MGVFVIQPRSPALSDITCSLIEDDSIDYQVIPGTIDFAEEKRVDLTSEGNANEMATAKFSMVVFGSTQANALANAETVRRAVVDKQGGYIQYRPIGLDSAMSTYYWYRGGKTPKMVQGVSATHLGKIDQSFVRANNTDKFAIALQIKVEIRPWATSDPSSYVTVVTSTSLSNCDDADQDNSVVVDNDDLKGAGFIPIIEATGNPGGVDSMLMQVRKMRTTETTRLDWIEGEDFRVWDTEPTLASASAGAYGRFNGGTDDAVEYTSFSGIDSTYVGVISPIVAVRLQTGTDSYRFRFYSGSPSTLFPKYVRTDWLDFEPGDTSWYVLRGFDEVPFPIVAIPNHIDDDSTPDVGGFVSSNAQLSLEWEDTTDGGGSGFDVDWVFMAKSDDWIAFFSGSSALSSRIFVVDGVSRDCWIEWSSSFEENLNKYGSAWADLFLEKGWDHRISFVWLSSNTGTFTVPSGISLYSHTTAYNVVVKGLHATIYPFSES